MTIEWLRDLIIIVTGIVIVVIVVFLALLAYLLYVRIRPILNSVRATTTTIEDIAKLVDAVASPMIKMVAIILGVKEGINAAGRFFKRRKEAK